MLLYIYASLYLHRYLFHELVNFSSQPLEFFLNIIFDDASQKCISPIEQHMAGVIISIRKGFGCVYILKALS